MNAYKGSCAFNDPLLYADNFGKPITVTQLETLVDLSPSCKQFISWKCFQAPINSPDNTTKQYRLTYWKNRYTEAMGYWGNATPIVYDTTLNMMCACGQTQTCQYPWLRCNCDMNDNQWREDSGYLTNNYDLPIQSFCAGDTGNCKVIIIQVTRVTVIQVI